MITLPFTCLLVGTSQAKVLWTALLLTLAALLIWSAIGRNRRLEREKRHHRLTPKRAKKWIQE